MKLAAWTEFRMGKQFKPTEDGVKRGWLWKLLLKTQMKLHSSSRKKLLPFHLGRNNIGSPNKVIRIYPGILI